MQVGVIASTTHFIITSRATSLNCKSEQMPRIGMNACIKWLQIGLPVGCIPFTMNYEIIYNPT